MLCLQRLRQVSCVLVAWLAIGGTATAEVVDGASFGAIVFLPYLTTPAAAGERATVATLTNALTTESATARLLFISGDPGDDWGFAEGSCHLTPFQTASFVFERDGEAGTVTFECSTLGAETGGAPETLNAVTTLPIPGRDGVLVAVLECQLGQPGCAVPRARSANALFGASTIVDFGQGYAVSLAGFQVPAKEKHDGDDFYAFDGDDYGELASLFTTHYIAADDDVTLELLAFTPDSTLGVPAPAELFSIAVDDDEIQSPATLEFDCFDVFDLTADPPDGFGNAVERSDSSEVGHIVFVPVKRTTNDDHELEGPSGDGSTMRKRPVIAWLLQTASGTVGVAANAFSVPAAWGRQVVYAGTSLVPEGTDVPSLDATGN